MAQRGRTLGTTLLRTARPLLRAGRHHARDRITTHGTAPPRAGPLPRQRGTTIWFGTWPPRRRGTSTWPGTSRARPTRASTRGWAGGLFRRGAL